MSHISARSGASAFAFRAFVMVAALLACSSSDSNPVAPRGGATASIEVTPRTPTVAIGSQLALQAQVQDANGQPVSGATIFWSSSDTTVATVSSTGVVTGRSAGSAQIAASSGGQSTLVVVSVIPVPIASLHVVPGAATVIKGGTAQLTAVAYDDAGATLTGRSVVWATSASQVATVDASGTVTGVAAGTAIVTATSEGKADSATITVTLVPVSAVSVTPGSAALNVGQSASFSAVATDENGNVLSGRSVTWSSSSSGIASVSSTGLVTANGAGSATITATVEGKHGVAQVVVSAPPPPPPAPVASVSVDPGSATLTVGSTTTLSATPRDSTGAPLNGRTVTWSSDAPAIATVSGSGVVTAVSPGTAAIRASSEGKSGTASITVQPQPPGPVTAVSVDPATASLAAGQTTTLTATAHDAGGNIVSGHPVTWSSASPDVATVDANGVVTAVSAGDATITATVDGVQGASQITVPQSLPAAVAKVEVVPATVTLHHNHTKTFVAHVYDADGNELLGHTVTWATSDDPTVSVTLVIGQTATVLAHHKDGPATITATCEGINGTATVTVTH
jgi:uncharacterized protein YjdB